MVNLAPIKFSLSS
jgi:hypothetical protein